jgi:anti-sigma regulatory factor (Ser/Thr protein kinase)
MTMQEQYRHEAVPYAGPDGLVSRGAALVEDAAANGEQVVFLLTASKTAALRDTLGDRSPDVTYVDMDEPGRNPARLLAMLDGFRAQAAGRRCVSVNEPVLAGAAAAVLAEVQLGESVLNAPALQSWPMSVRCLYDTAQLDAAALADMRRAHPAVHGEDSNPSYEPDLAGTLFAQALPAAPRGAPGQDVRGSAALASMRQFVRDAAFALEAERREDLVLAANEIVTNSLQHGGGECRISVWDETDSVVCEVRDPGQITDLMVGRLAPSRDAGTGRGLWLANHLCDLVQVRSAADGTTVRLHVSR